MYRAKQIEPVEVLELQQVHSRVYPSGRVILVIRVEGHGQRTGGARVLRMPLGLLLRLFHLRSNGGQKIGCINYWEFGNAVARISGVGLRTAGILCAYARRKNACENINLSDRPGVHSTAALHCSHEVVRQTEPTDTANYASLLRSIQDSP